MSMKKDSVLRTIISLALLTITILFSSCGDGSFLSENEEASREAEAYLREVVPNSEWRGKRDVDDYLDEDVHYVVMKFYGHNRYRVGYADQGGFIFRHVSKGVYEIKGREIIFYEGGSANSSPSFSYYYDDYRECLRGTFFGVYFYLQ